MISLLRRGLLPVLLVSTGCVGSDDAQGGRGKDDEEEGPCVAEADGTPWYLDADGDGAGASATVVMACAAPDGYVADPGDCDDTDAALAALSDWYADADGDGYGAGEAVRSCGAPEGRVGADTDCDDTSVDVSPGAVETCNERDDDCDGAVDDADASLDPATARVFYADTDGDGHGDAGSPTYACELPDRHTARATDCDDGDAEVHPDAAEVCENGVDDNCDGSAAPCGIADATLDGETAPLYLAGPTENERAGDQVSVVGDVNGDGYLDIVIGAPNYEEAVGSDGAFYVVSGPVEATSALTGAERYTEYGVAFGDDGGTRAVGWGDVNADGFDDWVVAASATSSYHGIGGALLYLGRAERAYDPDAELEVPEALQACKTPIDAGLDITGDGAADLVLGCYNYDSTTVNAGILWVVDSPPSGVVGLPDVAAAEIAGRTAVGELGGSATLAGDLDGDGVSELLVGETRTDSVYLFKGPITGELTTADAAARLTAANDDEPHVLSRAGDLDADGYEDVFVGGADRVYLGSATGMLDAGYHAIIGDVTAARHAGDVDGDGVDDLFLGCSTCDWIGMAYLVRGPIAGTIATDDDIVLTGVRGEYFGSSLAAGDIDGDGAIDLLIGAPAGDPAGYDGGAVYGMFGGGI